MKDTIERQAAIDAPERHIKDCNPEHFVGHQKFIEYMDNAEIGSFGSWQFANGFNMGLTAAEVAIKQLPSAQLERKKGKWVKEYWNGEHTRKCSACNITQTVTTYRGKVNFSYCPYCGADMRGGR